MNRLIDTLLRPSLARRIVGALMLAFVLVEAVLLAIDFGQYKRAVTEHTALRRLAGSMAPTLAALPERDAALVAASTLAQLNALRHAGGLLPDDLQLRLERRDGTVVYASPGWSAQPRAPMADEIVLAGRPHWLVQTDAGPWRVALAEPRLGDGWALRWLAGDLTQRMLIAFPLVLLPVWLAVHLGMRPLRELTTRLGQREGGDLAPLGIDLRHGELRPLALAFDALLERLRAHVRRERAFVQDAAHELRTPMAAIAAQAHVLARATDATDRQRAAASLEHALARTSHLSRQLLALASLDDAAARARERHDVVGLVQQALAQATPAAHARAIEVSLEAPERLPCTLDRGAFDAVVANLLDNAVRYGRPQGRIEVTLQGIERGFELRVADDGPGIAPMSRPRVFERFWRGTDPDAAGSGLGLAIVRQAVERLGGGVSIEDGLEGRGVAFRVSVPDVPA
jgi:signal transduction histidine kinase